MDNINIMEEGRNKKFGLRGIPLMLISILIPVAVGSLSACLTKDKMLVFDEINKPMFTPPSMVFPVVWAVLYVMMGVGLYLVLRQCEELYQVVYVMYPFAIQLLLNFCWSIIFFGLRSYILAFICLVLMLLMIMRTISFWEKYSKTAAYMMVVYMVWVVFAGYLNLGIVLIN